MLNNLGKMIKRQVKRNIPDADRIRRQVNRRVNETWKKNQSYENFWKKRLRSLGKDPDVLKKQRGNAQRERIQQRNQQRTRRIRRQRNRAQRRFQEIRERMRHRRDIPTQEPRRRTPAKSPPKNDVRPHTKPKEKNPRPSPRPDVIVGNRTGIQHPTPPSVESRNSIAKVDYNSKIGYATSIKRLEYYSEKPSFYSEPVINIDVSQEDRDYISLKPGDTWTSEWYETEILRGVDLNVIGTHRLNYLSNNDFEV